MGRLLIVQRNIAVSTQPQQGPADCGNGCVLIDIKPKTARRNRGNAISAFTIA
jgi:hypothetical protein